MPSDPRVPKGHGRHVDPELISALTCTAVTAARELAVLADIVPEARRMMIGELGLRSKINGTFLQVRSGRAPYPAGGWPPSAGNVAGCSMD
jgi:hypothetical protein